MSPRTKILAAPLLGPLRILAHAMPIGGVNRKCAKQPDRHTEYDEHRFFLPSLRTHSARTCISNRY